MTVGIIKLPRTVQTNRATSVIGAHGAGLSNVCFMKRGGLVVEILAPDRLWPTYRGVSARSGLNYAPYVAQADGEPNVGGSDMKLDPEHVAQFIEQAILEI
jgi:capsular polysaccharide biosynthesis protein